MQFKPCWTYQWLGLRIRLVSRAAALFRAAAALAFYYTLQCLVAFNVSQSPTQRFGIALVAAALVFITFFAVPKEIIIAPELKE